MRLVITRRARRDLEAARDYLEPLDPAAFMRFADAIESCFVLISEFPMAGRQTVRSGVREVVETKFGYLIPYYVEGETAYVLRIYNARRRPLNYFELAIS